MHSIVNRSGSSSAQAAHKAQEGAQKDSDGPDCAVNSASSSASAGLGSGTASQADVGNDGAAVAEAAGADSQAANAVKQQAPVEDYYRLWFTWSDPAKAGSTRLGTAGRTVAESTAGADTAAATRLSASVGAERTDGGESDGPISRNSLDALKQQQQQKLSVTDALKQQQQEQQLSVAEAKKQQQEQQLSVTDALEQQQEQRLSVADAKKQQLPVEDYYRLWFSWNSASAET